MFARIIPLNALAMDIHDIALTLFAQLVHANGSQPLTQDARIDMGREAYRFAEAYIAAMIRGYLPERAAPVQAVIRTLLETCLAMATGGRT